MNANVWGCWVDWRKFYSTLYFLELKTSFFVFLPIHISGVCYGRNIMHLCIHNEYKYFNISIIQLISNKAW